MPAAVMLQAITDRLAVDGLLVRGGVHLDGNDAGGAQTALLVGTAGADYWPHFERWRASQPVATADPLDRWSRELIEAIARGHGARAAFPSDRPYLPFQQWAMRAEGLRPSPLGILMHPKYGLWHAYRGALLFEQRLKLPTLPPAQHPCDDCESEPCRRACPIGAHAAEAFAVESCRTFARGDGAEICGNACLDRNACPVGGAFRYPVHVQRFHQLAFL